VGWLARLEYSMENSGLRWEEKDLSATHMTFNESDTSESIT